MDNMEQTTSPSRITQDSTPRPQRSQSRERRSASAGKVVTESSNSNQTNSTDQVAKTSTVSETVSKFNMAGQTSLDNISAASNPSDRRR